VYWPPEERLFSATGCKRVETLIKYEVANNRRKWDDEEDEEDDTEHGGEL